MANPAKRKVGATQGDVEASDEQTPSKRVTPPKRAQQGGPRYTPPSERAHRGPSPRWVPVLMFALWGVGLLVIILNYMEVLPGAGDGGNGWYLIGGLGAILGGIVAATQYH